MIAKREIHEVPLLQSSVNLPDIIAQMTMNITPLLKSCRIYAVAKSLI